MQLLISFDLKETDILPNLVAMTPERMKLVDVGYPSVYHSFLLMYKKPAAESRLFLVTKPFDVEVNFLARGFWSSSLLIWFY